MNTQKASQIFWNIVDEVIDFSENALAIVTPIILLIIFGSVATMVYYTL